jgi:hypothetical protein
MWQNAVSALLHTVSVDRHKKLIRAPAVCHDVTALAGHTHAALVHGRREGEVTQSERAAPGMTTPLACNGITGQ